MNVEAKDVDFLMVGNHRLGTHRRPSGIYSRSWCGFWRLHPCFSIEKSVEAMLSTLMESLHLMPRM